MTEKPIWIISPFSHLNSSTEPFCNSDRFLFIAKMLAEKGENIFIFTSSFDHRIKQKKGKFGLSGINVKLIYEPGYLNNVGFQRVLSHSIFNIMMFLCALFTIIFKGKPKCIYCEMPHNFCALLLGIISRLFNIKFIVDVHDTWPENILAVYKLKIFQKPFYHMWKFSADAAIYLADSVYSVSMRYADRANVIRIRYGKSLAKCIYLGGNRDYYLNAVGQVKIPPEISSAAVKFVYVGSLGRKNDLEFVTLTFDKLRHYYPNAWLLFLGNGELEQELRTLAQNLSANIWFSGYIEHKDMVAILRTMDYGINSFAAGGNVAYSYKMNDYLLAGIPVINSLPGEASALINRYNMGFNYKAGDVDELLSVLIKACGQRKIFFFQNIESFSSEYLNWNKTYEPLFNEILNS